MPDTQKSLTEAMDEVTEDSVEETDAGEETVEAEATDTETETDEGESEDAESDDDTEDNEDDEAESDTEASTTEEDEPSPYDDLTPEQLKAIKDSPELSAVYKSLVRASTKKFQAAGAAVRLAEAYKRDPVGVLNALATANGYTIAQPGKVETKAVVDQNREALEAAGRDLEKLFGDKIGPKVREVFDKYFDSRAGNVVEPIKSTLGRVVNDSEAARMMSEEQAFRVRHSKLLTPEIEAELVALGESGIIVPGEKATPTQYLDTLLNIVLAKKAKLAVKTAEHVASTRLARRIDANRRDREPTGVSARGPVKKVSAVKPNMSLSEAFDAAAKELEEESA